MLFYDRRRLFFACKLTRLLGFFLIIAVFSLLFYPLLVSFVRPTDWIQTVSFSRRKWHRKAAKAFILLLETINVHIFRFPPPSWFVDWSPHLCSAVFKHSGTSVKIYNNRLRQEFPKHFFRRPQTHHWLIFFFTHFFCVPLLFLFQDYLLATLTACETSADPRSVTRPRFPPPAHTAPLAACLCLVSVESN